MRLPCLVLLELALLAGPGCRPADGARSPAGPAASLPQDAALPTRAQARLPTIAVWLGQAELKAEVAVTPEQKRTGMMFRTNIAENEAMLFVFGVPHRAAFWMTNVPIALSCAYLSQDGEILEIHDLEARNPEPITARSDRVQFVLETAKGWFERHGIGTGVVVRTEAGSLAETFLRSRTIRQSP